MNYEKLWRIFLGKIVTIGNSPNSPKSPGGGGSRTILLFSAIRISRVGEKIHPETEKSLLVEEKIGCG